MPPQSSQSYRHVLKSLSLIALSLAFLPISTFILLASSFFRPLILSYEYVLRLFTPSRLEGAKSSSRGKSPKTILVTGVGMTKGLTLTRTFYLAGHRVIGADLAPFGFLPPCGRFSVALQKFYNLPAATEKDGAAKYIKTLLDIVHSEKVDLWVSCSGVASALEDAQAKEVIERRSDCLCIQFDITTTGILHSKDSFVEHTASIGLPVPETYNVTSRDAVHKVLHTSPQTKKTYIMKSVGVDDASRGEIMTLLPRRTLSQTYSHVAHLPISRDKPWVLQQYIPGKQEYCTHALVIRGKVEAFVACPSSDMLMHYEPLPHPESTLSRAMLRFTEEFVSRSSSAAQMGSTAHTVFEPMTGHLSFDFLIDEVVTEKGTESVLRAIECNPRAHTAVALFRGREKEMAEAYLTLLDRKFLTNSVFTMPMNGHAASSLQQSLLQSSTYTSPSQNGPNTNKDLILPLPNAYSFYWIGHDIVTLLFLPVLDLLLLPFTHRPTSVHTLTTLFLQAYPAALQIYISSLRAFFTHIFFWHDGTYEVWDPLPAWILYHVYWPGIFLGRIGMSRRGWWSKCNVGTTKIFGC